jgi:hypothetical protein
MWLDAAAGSLLCIGAKVNCPPAKATALQRIRQSLTLCWYIQALAAHSSSSLVHACHPSPTLYDAVSSTKSSTQ